MKFQKQMFPIPKISLPGNSSTEKKDKIETQEIEILKVTNIEELLDTLNTTYRKSMIKCQ